MSKNVSLLDHGRAYRRSCDELIGNTGTCARAVNLAGNTLLFAIFIIGALGAAQVFTGSVMAWTTVAIGGAYFAVKLFAKPLSKRKVDLLTSGLIALCIVTLGTLGGVSLLNTVQLGYALIGAALVTLFLTNCAILCAHRCRERADKEKEKGI